jgi:glycosyltransferase involved in cell wall biosynthesis
VSPPRVSVVIPTLNAAQTIEQQFAAIAGQDYRDDIEVIIADGGSRDGTREVARRWSNRIALRVVEIPGCVARAQNAGIAAATGSLILGCDADDLVDRAWVRILVHALEDADVVAGGIVDWDGGGLPEDPRPEPFGRGGFGFLPAFGGCNYGLRREVWDSLEGFDEEIRSGEDIDFAWRAQLAGYRFRSAPEGFVYYQLPQRPKDIFRKWLHYGEEQPALFRRFRSEGLGRQAPHRALARWALLLLSSYRLLGSANARSQWCQEMGRRVGRVIGSIRYRTVFL